MSRNVRRIPYRLDPGKVRFLPLEDIRAILRGADDLIMRGGRTLLTKILKGSRIKDLLEKELDKNPVYGFYRDLTEDEILHRIDWVIHKDFLRIEYDYRLPLLVFSPSGWAIEQETYAEELLAGFDRLIRQGPPFDMVYLKDRQGGVIMSLLEKVEASRSPDYIPVLEAWKSLDCKKVRARIGEVLVRLRTAIREV
jgi:hypothetical protein